MIFVTADTHADLDRLVNKQLKHIKIGDTLIVLGDFGFIWNNDKAQQKALKKIAKLPFKILFLDGLHENFSLINEYPDVTYCSAKAKEIVKDKIYYIKHGEILQLEGKKILCFGGAQHTDEDLYFDYHQVDAQAFENCLANIQACDFTVDYVLTHMPSGKISRFIDLESSQSGTLLDFLDILTDKLQYKRWYFGFHHIDKYISSKCQAVYKNVYLLAD